MRSILLALAVALAACSDPAGTDEPVRLVIEPAGQPRTVLIGSFQQLAAHTVTADGRAATPASVSWSTSDETVARIDNRGELRIATTYTACNWVTPGDCTVRITARAGSLVAEQIITVMPYTPIITVDARQLDIEMGDSARLTSKVLLEGQDVPWCAISYESQDPTIARVDATRGVVTGVDEGITFIDVHVNGPMCPPAPEHVRVINRPPWHTLSILPDSEPTMKPGNTLQLVAQVRNGKGVEYPAIVVTWMSSDPEIAAIGSNGVVRALGCADSACRVTITARSSKLTATKLILVE